MRTIKSMPGARRWRALALLVVATLLGAIATGCGGSSSSSGEAGQRYEGDLTYWYWGESDAPGANDWMKQMIARYEELHPKVHIKLVPQSTETLIGAFKTAAQTKSGPDIATQWATLPVLTPAWTGATAPLSDLIPKKETDNWVSTQENMSEGKLWGMPQYLLGVPFVWNKQMFSAAGLDPDTPPATFDELMNACKRLKAKGYTPIGMGNKDGYAGAWMFAIYGKSQLDNVSDLQDMVLDEGKFSDPKHSGFYEQVDQLRQNGCFNDDISSLDLDQGWQLFPRKKAAMAWTTDGNALSWAEAIGADNIGVAAPPRFGDGALASYYTTTQSSSAMITSWSKHKNAAAAFLTFLHTPEAFSAWYEATGVFPADKRFSTSRITNPVAKQLYELATQKSLWGQNYLPPQVDQNANLPAGQSVISGSGSPSEAVELWGRVLEQWKTQHPDEYQNYEEWAGG